MNTTKALYVKDIFIEKNNFDLIRLLAALSVIYSHGTVIFHNKDLIEPISYFLGWTDMGTVAVNIFFFISGLLISMSFVGSKSATRFILMRLGRICPGLYVCTLIMTFGVGPYFTNLSLKEYYAHQQTWSFLQDNLSLRTVAFFLPGVFLDNHYPAALNGSIWTIPYEIKCYVCVLMVGLMGGFASKRTILVSCIFLAILGEGFLWQKGSNDWATMCYFILGMLVYGYQDWIRLHWSFLIVLLGLFEILVRHDATKFYAHISLGMFLAYGVLYVANLNWLKKIHLPGDYSYGVYIYGFLIQQICSHYFKTITSFESLFLTFPLSLMAGYISWNLVEKPGRNLAKFLAKYLDENLIFERLLQLYQGCLDKFPRLKA